MIKTYIVDHVTREFVQYYDIDKMGMDKVSVVGVTNKEIVKLLEEIAPKMSEHYLNELQSIISGCLAQRMTEPLPGLKEASMAQIEAIAKKIKDIVKRNS